MSNNVLLYTYEWIEEMSQGYFSKLYPQERNVLKNIHQKLERIYFDNLANGAEDRVYPKELIKNFMEINGDKIEKNYLRLIKS